MTAVPKRPSKTTPSDGLPRAAKGAGTAMADAPAPPPAPAADQAWQNDFMADLRLEDARIPPRFQDKTFDKFHIERNAKRKALLEFAQGYVKGFNFNGVTPFGLLLRGGVGCGKTHIAVAILKAIVANRYRGLYYNIVDLLAEIRRTYNQDNSLDESEFLDELLAPDLLVIDDLGCEKTSEWVNDRLYLIINRRYDACRPILVTTNLMTVDEMESKIGKRITSRLCEMCQSFPEFPDEDYRKKHMH